MGVRTREGGSEVISGIPLIITPYGGRRGIVKEDCNMEVFTIFDVRVKGMWVWVKLGGGGFGGVGPF